MTYKTLINEIRTYCESGNTFIHDFGMGYINEIDTTDRKYVLAWLDPFQDNQISNNQSTFNFKLVLADLLKTDESNLIDILNDTHLIALDIIAHFQKLTVGDYKVTLDTIISPFTEQLGGNCAGQILQLQFKVKTKMRSCYGE